MNFGFTEDQDLLRSEVRKFLAERCPFDEVRRIGEEQNGFCAKLWSQVAELGWPGLIIPEEYGGAGLAWIDLVVLLEEAGRHLLPLPLLSSVTATQAIVEFGSERQRAEWLPRLANGKEIGTLAIYEDFDDLDPRSIGLHARRQSDGTWRIDGEKVFVPDATHATLFVVAVCDAVSGSSSSPRFALVPAAMAGVEVDGYPTMDLTKPMGRVRFEGVSISADSMLGDSPVPVPALDPDVERGRFERILARATAALCAEISGAAEANLQLAIDYAKERVQFGSPIGRYQGVKHPLAEMHQELESFKSLLYYAAWALDERPEEANRYVSMAKARGSECAARIGIDAIQIHGAVGYTWEYDPQLFLKRSKWSRAMYGDADHHYDQIAELGGI